MTAPACVAQSAIDALMVDEVGVHFAVLGQMRLKSLFQPVFEIRGQTLKPVAVSCTLAVQSKGCTVSTADFLASLTGPDRRLAEAVAALLHVRNHENFGDDCPALHLDAPCGPGTHPDDAIAMIAHLLAETAQAEMNSRRLHIDLGSVAMNAPSAIVACAGLLARHGAGIASDVATISGLPDERAAAFQTGMVVVPSPWLHRLSREAAATGLMKSLVAALHGRGAVVKLEGIDTPEHLLIGHAAGFDLLQGNLLGGPLLAGCDPAAPDEPGSIQTLIANVVPLFGHGHSG